MRRLAALYFALVHAIDRDQQARATELAEQLGAGLSDYPAGFRQAMAVELVLFHALYRHDLDAALAFHAHGRGGIVDPARRALAEGALAALQGDPSAALRCIEKARRSLAKSSDRGLRLFTADQLAQLQSQLASAT